MYQAQIVYKRATKSDDGSVTLRGTIDTIPNLKEPPSVSVMGGIVMLRFGQTLNGVFYSFYEITMRQEHFYRLTVIDTSVANFKEGQHNGLQ